MHSRRAHKLALERTGHPEVSGDATSARSFIEYESFRVEHAQEGPHVHAAPFMLRQYMHNWPPI